MAMAVTMATTMAMVMMMAMTTMTAMTVMTMVGAMLWLSTGKNRKRKWVLSRVFFKFKFVFRGRS